MSERWREGTVFLEEAVQWKLLAFYTKKNFQANIPLMVIFFLFYYYSAQYIASEAGFYAVFLFVTKKNKNRLTYYIQVLGESSVDGNCHNLLENVFAYFLAFSWPVNKIS